MGDIRVFVDDRQKKVVLEVTPPGGVCRIVLVLSRKDAEEVIGVLEKALQTLKKIDDSSQLVS